MDIEVRKLIMRRAAELHEQGVEYADFHALGEWEEGKLVLPSQSQDIKPKVEVA
jgi:hypothetical protein